jgi:hypothetical protein
MSPSPAIAPRRRGAPDAFGAARLLYEKTAGRSCRRRARTTFHSTTGATALPRAPSDKGLRPTGFLPLLDRPPAAASGPSCDSANTCGVARPDRRRSAPPKDPNAHRKAGLFENGLASHLDHRSRRHRNAAATAIDAGQPALGRAATTRGPATPTLSLLGRARIGARPDALAYWWNSDPNPSSQQPVSRYSVVDSCAWIPKQRTIHRPLIHGIVHKAAVALT